MLNLKKVTFSIFLSFLSLQFLVPTAKANAFGLDFSFIILSHYQKSMNIGEEFYIIAFTSSGKKPTWKSSNSKVASVNTYGKVTAKKAGSTVITAKTKDAYASCIVSVKETTISISHTKIHLQRGESMKLHASTSDGSKLTWKSRKTSVATIDDKGVVTGHKPGESLITCSANGTKVTCQVIVDYPTVTLNKSKITLYRGQTAKLTATISSKGKPKWKTNKKSVAIVDQNGNITAIKNGTATITVTLDGVSTSCEVTVKKPTITLSTEELTMKVGSKATIRAKVSSGNKPTWSTSNSKILFINSNGQITALKKGRAYVYAKEDGTKVKCTVYVTD